MATILDDITAYLDRFMVLPSEDEALVIALWVLHTWTFSQSFARRPYTTPYLYIHSPEKQSGKTLLLDLIEPIVLNPERSVDMSASVLFRLIEEVQPTIMLDEMDTIYTKGGSANEALRGVLNGGYKRGGYVWRTEGLEPRKFATFSPKVFAGIDNGLMPDTVRDRCIPIRLRRKRAEDAREVYYSYKVADAQEELSHAIDMWVHAHGDAIVDYDPSPIAEMGPRAWEIAMPLVQIARVVGCLDEARAALSRLLQPVAEKDSPGVALLRTIRDLFEETGADKLHTAVIIERLGDGWNGKLLSNRLNPYDVGAPGTIRINNKTLKGFYKHQFTDAWGRYL